MGAVLPYDSLVSRLENLQCYVVGPHEVLARSVVEVNKTDTYVASVPVDNGLFDLRMGTVNNCHPCRTCGQRMNACVGHFGHIELAQPVFYAQFFGYVKKLMKVVCHRCSCLYIADPENPQGAKDALCKIARSKRLDTAIKAAAKVKKCPCCGGRRPDRVMKEPVIRLVLAWKASRLEEETRTVLPASQVMSILAQVSDVHCEALGFSRHNRPEWMVCSVLPCPPPCIRPSARNDAGQRAEDDITHKLIDVLKANAVLKQRIEKNVPLDQMESSVQLLQYHVATLVDNQMNGVNPSAQRNGRVITSVSERLKAKNGRIRGSLMGKRVDFSARTVITADPNICVDELGIPLRIAMNLTFPEVVNRHNVERLNAMVRNGPDVYPGAKFVRKGRRIIMIRNARKVAVELEEGDVVDRHLVDGDYVIFNRQPSLHRCSMMAHAIRVLPCDTFRLNVCVTPPYNADFDGDEANIHVPQSMMTMVELGMLSAVPHHVISPRDSKPIVSIVQDVALGVYRMTIQDGWGVCIEDACNTISRLSVLATPKVRAWFEGMRTWAGRTLVGRDQLSLLLPYTTCFHGPNRFYDESAEDAKSNLVVIDDGVIKNGIVDKTIYQSRSKGILHSTYNVCGPQRACSLLDDTQKMVCDWLVLSGASVGLSDFIVSAHTRDNLDEVIRAMKVEVYDIIRQAHLSHSDDNDHHLRAAHEKEINNVLNHTVSKAGKIGLSTISSTNRMIQMVKSGSKGNVINVSQIVACVGQQNVDGKRIDNGFDGRTLPHFNKYDVGPKARGFVENSFLRGLDPEEFFFHAMAGREGLIHTAVNTSETGYIQRKLVKAMEDCKAAHDGSVRDANANIVSFKYGDDGFDATRLEAQNLFFLEMDEPALYEEFFLSGLEDHMDRIVADRMALVGPRGPFQHDKEYVTMLTVNVGRLLRHHKRKVSSDAVDVQDARDVVAQVEKTICDLFGANETNNMVGVVMRTYLSPKRLALKYGIRTVAHLMPVLGDIVDTYEDGVVHANEMVGIVAAQSIGEPSSQCTLNTFHFSGVASASQVVRGVPRLKELLSVAKAIKSPCMTVHLVPSFAGDKVKAHSVTNDIRSLHVNDLYTKSEVFFDPSDVETTVANDVAYIARDTVCSETNTTTTTTTKCVPWILRIELDREKMDMFDVTMLDVAACLERYHGDKMDLFFTDDCDEDLIMRVRPKSHVVSEGMSVAEVMLVMHAMQRSILDGVCLKGIPGIRGFHMALQRERVHDVKGAEDRDSWVLYTDGSALTELLAHPHVDARRTITNDVSEVHAVLGIEAARAMLIAEVQGIMKDADVSVNDRHVSLLADVMTCKGTLTSIDRHGMNRGDAGFLSKCSFEETVDVLVKAAVFNEVEHMNSVSSNVIFGQVPTAGTGVGRVRYDTSAIRTVGTGSEVMPAQLSTLFTTKFSLE